MSKSTVTPYQDSDASKKKQIAEMFDNVAPRYDFLNHLLSMGIDRWWRKKAINQLKEKSPKHILDIATGTGDFALAALKLNPDKITGIDISEGMLELGRKKIAKKGLSDRIELLQGDSENIGFENNTFDGATVAYGVRNFENLQKGMNEIFRVMKPGGKMVVLEFSKPKVFPIKQLFGFYFRFILPLVGKIFSKDKRAYEYLPESVQAFPEGDKFIEILEKSGFKNTKWIPLTFGISSIYTGEK